jgi:hypothetical protein
MTIMASTSAWLAVGYRSARNTTLGAENRPETVSAMRPAVGES